MSSVKHIARQGKVPRAVPAQGVRFGPESVAKYSKAFSKSVFQKEIEASLDIAESIIALTDDDRDCEMFVEAAEKRFESTFFVVSNRMKTRHVRSRTIKCPVLTVRDLFVNLKHVPNRSCVVFDDLWVVAHPYLGGLMEQILVTLPKQCVIVIASKPFSNITVFYHWLSSVHQNSLRIIEAPFERCPSSYYVLVDKPRQLKLVRNSALSVDVLELREALSAATDDFVSMDAVEWVIEELLANGSGPVLVIVPCECCVSDRYPFLTSKSGDIDDVIARFQSDDNSVLFVTIKVAESVVIPAQSVVITSLFKYDGIECREMKPFEFYHLVSAAGRVGVDTQGFVVTALMKQVNEGRFLQTLAADIPSLNPHFSMEFHSFLNCQFCDVKDMDDTASRTFNGFCQTQVVPILRDQLHTLEAAQAPPEVGAACVKIHELETAISTLCTHPRNIRKLLVNGRVVRVGLGFGESPWGICYGPSICGTVTIAMKGVENRRPLVDSGDKCLVTLPISEVLAVSSSVNCLQRQTLQEFDDSPFVLENDYPLYDGDDLDVGNERLHRLHVELRESLSALDSALAPRWREIAELVFKVQYLTHKIDSMSKHIGIGQPQKFADHLRGTCRQGSDITLSVLQKIPIANGLQLKEILESENLGSWSVRDVTLLLLSLGSKNTFLSTDTSIPDDLQHLIAFSHHASLLAVGSRWLSEQSETSFKSWTLACLFKRVANLSKHLHRVTTEFGSTAIAEKFHQVTKYVTSQTNFVAFFSK